MIRIPRPLAIACLGLVPLPALAFQPMSGFFVADDSCPASPSIGGNAGGVTVEAGRAYMLLGANKPGGDWYQLRIEGAPAPSDRWVSAKCGAPATAPAAGDQTSGDWGDTVTDDGSDADSGDVMSPDAGDNDATDAADAAQQSDWNVLALSWEPAFCETGAGQGKTECRALDQGKLPEASTALSIHGLWPEPEGNENCDGPDATQPQLSGATMTALHALMPGTASGLEVHEWSKHGTCYGDPDGAEGYFRAMIELTRQVNASAVGKLFAGSVGQKLTAERIRAAFDQAYGTGAGGRVAVECVDDGSRKLISELRIGLRGLIGPDTEIGPLILSAAPVGAGCAQGILDRPGAQ